MDQTLTASTLTRPALVIVHLQDASRALDQAHRYATESEGNQTDLNGAVRDAIFGLNTAVDSLRQMIEEGRFT